MVGGFERRKIGFSSLDRRCSRRGFSASPDPGNLLSGKGAGSEAVGTDRSEGKGFGPRGKLPWTPPVSHGKLSSLRLHEDSDAREGPKNWRKYSWPLKLVRCSEKPMR